MTDATTAATQAPVQRQAARIGSFLLGDRVPELSDRVGGAVFARATGVEGSAHAGINAVAMCVSLPEGNPSVVEQANGLLGRLQGLRSPWLAPVLEAGAQGRIAYAIEETGRGERLSARLARERKLAPWQAVTIVNDVAAGLSEAHAQRISHGAVVPEFVWVDGTGRARLGGFGLMGRGPSRDQWLLASLTFQLLSGIPWSQEYAGEATGPALVDRVRGRTNGLTEQVGRVIAKGLEREAAAQHTDIQAYARALNQAVADSGVELAAGAWEAISRNDLTMAAILVDMTSSYNPAQPELAVLRVRLNGGAMRDTTYATATLAAPPSSITMTAPDVAAVMAGHVPITPSLGIDAAGVPMPAAMAYPPNVALGQLAPSMPYAAGYPTPGFMDGQPVHAGAMPQAPFGGAMTAPGGFPQSGWPGAPVAGAQGAAVAPSKPARSPWLIFAIGASALVIVLTILVAVTFSTV